MIPPWARVGAMCVCIDPEWVVALDDGGIGDRTNGPAIGDICTITSAFLHNGEAYIQIAEWGHFGWQLDCFRPVTQLESDVMMFKYLSEGIGDLREVELV